MKKYLIALFLVVLISDFVLADEPYHVKITNSQDKSPMKDVKVEIRGMSKKVGGTTDSYGVVKFDEAPFSFDEERTGEVKILMQKDGFIPLEEFCPCNSRVFSLSPQLAEESIRVVLNWGRAPKDLDSHLKFGDYKVNHGNREAGNAVLDTDDTNGEGPETITIKSRIVGTEYLYFVHDYSNRSISSFRLSDSNARVYVYFGDAEKPKIINIFKGGKGPVWEVFKLDTRGEFHEINRIVEAKPE